MLGPEAQNIVQRDQKYDQAAFVCLFICLFFSNKCGPISNAMS